MSKTPQKEITAGSAAAILSDELMNMRMRLERVEVALQEITNDYFGRYEPWANKEHRAFVAFEHKRYSIYGDIVSDYLFQIREIIDRLVEAGKAAK